ncbi:MAG: YegP family protein [Gammaproteobacteria bacterium]|nr:YegP family protein [Gammaproteobacteria bacterium]MDH5240904.1 YegP family protein [Gammaproteobacteria bacterium]MDH5261102.1 YegP family protein [Gammaproteobacteria bacterium]MDH5583682.1 YegP family protein [Gammaproteobacteria bacterium]
MAGKFECYKDKAGEFRFRLKAGNGETILSSEGYSSKSGCESGIASVKKNSSNPDRFEKTETAGGKFRFNLKASNGQVIGTSQNYASAATRDSGIKSVANSAPDAKVVEES